MVKFFASAERLTKRENGKTGKRKSAGWGGE